MTSLRLCRYFIMDNRYTADGIGKTSRATRYMHYKQGNRETITDIQSRQARMPGYTDQ